MQNVWKAYQIVESNGAYAGHTVRFMTQDGLVTAELRRAEVSTGNGTVKVLILTGGVGNAAWHTIEQDSYIEVVMDAGIADALNGRYARLVAEHLDKASVGSSRPWYVSGEARAMMSSSIGDGEKAWLFGALAANVAGLNFDGPADGDWENLFSSFRAEILARRDRDPKSPSVQVQPLSGMV